MNILIDKLEWCGEKDCNKCNYVDFEPDDTTMNYCTLHQANIKQKGKDWYFVKWVEGYDSRM